MTKQLFTTTFFFREFAQKTTSLRRFISSQWCSSGLNSRLFDHPSVSELCFVHDNVFIGSRAVDPFPEDSLAYSPSYRHLSVKQGHDSTHRGQTSPPSCGLHRFPLHNGAIPKHASTRLGDWVVGLSPAEGTNGDPCILRRRMISAELADQLLPFIHEPTLTILRIGRLIGIFCLLPHGRSLATQRYQLK